MSVFATWTQSSSSDHSEKLRILNCKNVNSSLTQSLKNVSVLRVILIPECQPKAHKAFKEITLQYTDLKAIKYALERENHKMVLLKHCMKPD